MVKNLNELEQELRAVVRGEREPSPPPEISEPKDLLSVVRANLGLLVKIAQERPETVSQLAALTGRAQSNVSRSLQDLARHGLVRMVREGKQIRPVLAATEVRLDLNDGSCRLLPHAAAAE